MIAWMDLKLNLSEETKLRRVCRKLNLSNDYFEEDFFNNLTGYKAVKKVLLTSYADSTIEDLLFRLLDYSKD